MPKYRIKAEEIWYSYHEVDADNEEEVLYPAKLDFVKFEADDDVMELKESEYDRIEAFDIDGIEGDGSVPWH